MNVNYHLNLSPSSLEIIYRSVDGLRPDPANPRCHSKKQVRQIAESIKAFGFNVPILIDRDGNVVAGTGRLAACGELGMTQVPTLCLDHLTPAQLLAFRIADNRLTEIATWDDQLLAEQLKDLSLLGLDFSLEVTGFDMAEIDLRIQSFEEPPEGDDPADGLPGVAAGPPVSKLGDFWRLGHHRLLCGSALDTTAFAALMGEERASVVFTDPPYNVPIDGHASGLGAIHHRPFPMASGEMNGAEFTAFLRQAFGNLAASTVDGALHYNLHGLAPCRRAACRRPRRLWRAEKPVRLGQGQCRGSLYRSQHELIFVFKHGRQRHRNNVQLGQFGRNRSNVWHYPGANSFARCGAEGNLSALHPTVKPVAMIADAILDSSARGDIVLDGFLGSGTTVIAAERTGRRCYGIELDPVYVDTIIRRWQGLTGGSADHAASGRGFDDLAREAEAANG